MKETHRGTCLCCPRTEDELPLDTVLYNGFGGYHVTRNDELFYMGDPSEQDWDKFETLDRIEKVAKKFPLDEWKIVLNNPLRGAIWKRKDGKYILSETNQGFA